MIASRMETWSLLGAKLIEGLVETVLVHGLTSLLPSPLQLIAVCLSPTVSLVWLSE